MTEPAGNTVKAPAEYRDHLVVCGLNGLGLRLVEHLHALGQKVVVVPGETTRAFRAAVEALGIPVVDGSHDDEFALVQAGVEHADAMAFVADGDIGNLRGALVAAKHGTELRIVLRLFNEALGDRIQDLFEECVILSQSGIAAPFFAAAALGDVDGERVALAGHALLVRRLRPGPDPHGELILPLANPRGDDVDLFPERADDGGEVLVDLGPFEGAALGRLPAPARPQQSLSDRWWAATTTVRQIIDRRMRIVILAMVLLLVAASAYFSVAKGLDVIDAVYFTAVTLSTVGYGDFNLMNDSFDVKFAGIAFIIVGATTVAIFFAILTDTIVGVRLAQILGGVRGRLRGHVVVCGLGDVGFRVVEHLAQLGVPVVGIERDPNARHLAAVRRLGLPVVIGDATLSDALHEAQIERARALVTCTDNDVADLEVAVSARALHPDLRIVLRLFDHDLSTAVERRFNIHISRSTEAIAAPVFATQMAGHDLVTTVHVAGIPLALAEFEVDPGDEEVGRTVSDLEDSTELRVLAIVPASGGDADWKVDRSRKIAAGERLAVVGRPRIVRELAAGPAAA